MTTSTTVLRGGGAAVVLHHGGTALPAVLHWGRELTDAEAADLVAVGPGPVPHNALDAPWDLSVLPTSADGWLGTPGLAAHRGGGHAAPRWTATLEQAGATARVRAVAEELDAVAELTYALDEHGVLTVSSSLTSTADEGTAPLDLAALRTLLPLPTCADEVLDLSGRWLRERTPQRRPLADGTLVRTGRRGRTGHDATLLLTAGTAGFGFRHGEVWSVHVAWSGNHEHLVERLPEGAGAHAAVIGGGEALAPGEVRLGPGESYAAPDLVAVWSAEGLDGTTRRLVRHQRAGYDARTARPRPLVLNTWEAVYFSSDLGQLTRLADTAAAVGVERFVLDDGWFGGRRDDTRGLGDWRVSDEVWPGGLGPLVEHVRGLGMEFGLWFEPEMVNLDSDLARDHPGWVLGPVAGPTPPSRHQHVLDLTNPEAFAHVLEAMSALVAEHGIAFVKWDHNRDLHEAVRSDTAGTDRPAVHSQTLAAYRLMDELRHRHPDLEIESCSSGGARVDLGVLARTDRVWTSDCNDALERVAIQRWTGLLVGPERMGTHIGPPRAHSTHRDLDLSFRMLVALGGHAGLEWDLTTCSPEDLDALRAWAALYKELRPLLHHGDVVRSDHPDPALVVGGVVAPDRSEAVLTVAQVASTRGVTPGRLPLPGLDPDARYLVRVRPEAGLPEVVQTSAAPWFDRALDEGVEFAARVLGEVGLPLPVLAPAQGFLLHLTRC
ncbi:alpha-galactosidase [Phycicoccus sonneratiae]|uniref:alpha-galactosidase n=1 Tax=Phycicoccus sonneratiae TaxID=2807628 RepID=A0ABS2CG51_9MICO|nr:alpha-galactosidase [Phycicoccus sonneraticus]MBM6398790.1 alpha-galactosidase [Phycicoccus sonneraticus]